MYKRASDLLLQALRVSTLSLSTLMLSTLPLYAADSAVDSAPDNSGSSSSEESAQGSQTDVPANASGSQKRNAGDKGGVFLPSEDISEDVAITFPVDI